MVSFPLFVGSGPYKLLQSILAPAKLTEKTFEELAEVLKNHLIQPTIQSDAAFLV